MTVEKKKIVVAITGASGAIYSQRLLFYFSKIIEQIETVDLVFTENADSVWKYELAEELPASFKIYKNDDFFAPFASGSAKYDSMIICPASMGMIGRIAAGVSNDLISRAADVMLKERKKLIVVPRETPYNLIHLRNMTSLTEAGAIIIPASPSFYSKPDTIEKLVDTVVFRILDLINLDFKSYRWGE